MNDDVTLGEVVRSLQRIERALDTVTGDHEARLRKVERWVYAVPPTLMLAVASVIAGVLR
jgi:hypothetical protein